MTDAGVTRIARAAGEAAKACGVMIATAESCTGGGIAEALTRIPGSSAWFDRGFITYTNEAKREMLGVSTAALRRHGAVSEAVARQMAEGALERSRAGAAVAVTGIAGPGGATPGKPVGLVCFAWAARGMPTQSRTFRFPGGRTAVRRSTVAIALRGLLDLLRGR